MTHETTAGFIIGLLALPERGFSDCRLPCLSVHIPYSPRNGPLAKNRRCEIPAGKLFDNSRMSAITDYLAAFCNAFHKQYTIPIQ